MNFFCLANWFTICRLSVFLWRWRKMKVSKKTITTKINNDMIFSFFRKLRKNEFWTYIAHVIVLTICFQSVMVMVFTLLFIWYFRKLWCICDLISVYYLMENYPCYLWIEIFDKLRICCCVWPKFCWVNFGKLLVTFLAKSKTAVL